jgi:predicted alpha/beta hydrolase
MDGSARSTPLMDGEADMQSSPLCDATVPNIIGTHWTRVLHRDLLASHTAADDLQREGAFERRWPDEAARDTRVRRASRCAGERVRLLAADGYPLGATWYGASGVTRAHIVVAGAVGVSQRFYRRFAQFAAAAGYATMTFDYRGVGLSAPATLEGFRMDYFDWGRLDLAAAVAAASRQNLPLYVVGHSFGGHAFGVLPNQEQVAAFYTFGTGAGWHGWMPLLERIKVLAMWRILGPALTAWKGYLSWSLLGMGEDLPLDFYRRWKHWCRYPNYFFNDPAMRGLTRDFDRIRAPVMAANSIDDRWAPPQSRDAFMLGYRNALRHTLDIDPAFIGARGIGHMGYFRAEATPLWEPALEWLASSAKPAAPSASSDADDRASFWRSLHRAF